MTKHPAHRRDVFLSENLLSLPCKQNSHTMIAPKISPAGTPSPFFGERVFGVSGTIGLPRHYPEQPVSPNDDDFRRAITAEELLVGIHEDIHRKFASRRA
jgi:hypothetical protein